MKTIIPTTSARSLVLAAALTSTLGACTPDKGDSSTTGASATTTSATVADSETATSGTTDTATSSTETDASTASSTTTSPSTTSDSDTTDSDSTTTSTTTTTSDTDSTTTTTSDSDTDGDPLLPHLVGYWPFNGDSEDHSGANIDLTFVGDPDYAGSVSGGLGQALALDGDDGAIGADFVKFSGDDATIVAWVRSPSLQGTWNTIIKNWGTVEGQFHLGLNAGQGNLRNDILGATIYAPEPFVTGEWQHAVVVLDSVAGAQNLYLNGVLVASDSYTPPLAPGAATGLGIGVKPNNDGTGVANAAEVGYWIGEIDEVGLYDIALTPEEVTMLHSNGLAGVQLDGTSE